MSQNQPPSYTQLCYFGSQAHIHTRRAAPSPLHTETRARRAHSIFWGPMCGPPHHHSLGAAWRPPPGRQHIERFLYAGTPACRVLGGIHLFRGVECPMMSCTPISACLCLSHRAWCPGSHRQLPGHLSHPSMIRLLVLAEMDLKEGREYPPTPTRRVSTSHSVTGWKGLKRCLITYPGCNQLPNYKLLKYNRLKRKGRVPARVWEVLHSDGWRSKGLRTTKATGELWCQQWLLTLLEAAGAT